MFKKKEVHEKKFNIGFIIGITAFITGMAALIFSVVDILKGVAGIRFDAEDFDNLFDDEDINI